MPNHYDTDVYCEHCRRYMYSYLHEKECTGDRFCSKHCEQEHKKKSKKDAKK